MRYPGFLKKGGRIGLIAPSFGAVIEPYYSFFNNALKKFESLGYSPILGPNCYENKGIGKSNTSEKCGEEINDFFTNDRCDVIISCGGGETMCEDLPFVDFDAIKAAEPKWYMGFSDNTNLTMLLPTICDTAAIYGPNASSFGMEPWHDALWDALGLLTGEKLDFKNYDKWEKEKSRTQVYFPPYNVTEPYSMKIWNDGYAKSAEFSGRLLGGCLDCLSILCGTSYDRVTQFNEKYADDGIIWFLEACELNPIGVRRVLWQLDNAGWFEKTAGFIIGRPMMIDADGMGMDRFEAVTGILSKYEVPILMDTDLGHLPPMIPIISGGLADVKAAGNELKISFKPEA